jgi:hypothetical protein
MAILSQRKLGRRRGKSTTVHAGGDRAMSRLREMTLEQLIAHYRRGPYPRYARKEAESYRALRPHLDVAIRSAVKRSPLDGRKHRHQLRLPNGVLSEAESKLLAVSKDIKAVKHFEALYDLVNREIGSIDGIGPLTVYDIAHRIGAYFGQEPTLVYLHSGTAKGAAFLGFAGVTVSKEELPEAFSVLKCAEIEDFFCIYKAQLAGKSLADLRTICFLPEDHVS